MAQTSHKGKDNYAKYKTQCRREKNKELKAQRYAKRLAKFEARKAAGKTYKYEPIKAEKNSKRYVEEQIIRSQKNITHKSEIQILTSVMRKVDNLLTQQKIEAKKQKAKKDHEQG